LVEHKHEITLFFLYFVLTFFSSFLQTPWNIQKPVSIFYQIPNPLPASTLLRLRSLKRPASPLGAPRESPSPSHSPGLAEARKEKGSEWKWSPLLAGADVIQDKCSRSWGPKSCVCLSLSLSLWHFTDFL
jgi:hypothetical protein